jgi:hypothetical protein
MAQLTARSSTIFIATGHETRVYRTVDDVPSDLRQKLIDCTRGINSATILIADKRGREELVRALQGRPSEVQCRLVENIRSRQPDPQPKSEAVSRSRVIGTWLELLLPLIACLSLWIALEAGSR